MAAVFYWRKLFRPAGRKYSRCLVVSPWRLKYHYARIACQKIPHEGGEGSCCFIIPFHNIFYSACWWFLVALLHCFISGWRGPFHIATERLFYCMQWLVNSFAYSALWYMWRFWVFGAVWELGRERNSAMLLVHVKGTLTEMVRRKIVKITDLHKTYTV